MIDKARATPWRLFFLVLALGGLLSVVRRGRGPGGGVVEAEQSGAVLVELAPGVLTVPPAGAVEVALDAGTEKVGFARIELLFDPAVVALTGIDPGPALAPVSTSTPAEANASGRVVVAQRAREGTLPGGRFSFATLYFAAATGREEQHTTLAVDPAGVQIVTEGVTEAPVTVTSTRIGANPAPVSCLTIGDIPLAECEALKVFYTGSGGNEWGNWFSGDAACGTWTGVACAGGHVSGLNLAGKGIAGTIPAALGDLPTLERLNLAHNELGGAIPAELGALARLKLLDLHANRLSGPIPAALTALSGLSSLDLGYNLLAASNAQVAAFLSAHDSEWAQTQTVAPAGLAAAEVRSSALTLTWEDGAGDGFYEVYVAPATGGPYSFVARTAGAGVRSHSLDGLKPDTTYFFKMRTYTPANTEQLRDLVSGYTPALRVTTPLPPPAVSATRGSYPGRVQLSWEAVPGATAYRVYRADTLGGAWAVLATTSGTVYGDRGASAGEIYFYWVATCKGENCGEVSAAVAGWHGDVPTVYVPVIRR